MTRTFLLSPAYAAGRRAQMLLNEGAEFHLARRLRDAETVSLGEVFAFLSGLYFRGKLAYANAFARPDRSRVLVITPTHGLVPAVTPVTLSDLREFAEVEIEEGDPRYRKPLERDLRRLVRRLSPRCEVVLLGSVATGKYLSVLLDILPERLRFPAEFVGRGDMHLRRRDLVRNLKAGTKSFVQLSRAEKVKGQLFAAGPVNLENR